MPALPNSTFVIRDVGAGTRTVEARLIGYSPHRIPIEFRETAEASVTLVLPVQRVELDTMRVVAGRDIPFFVRSIERRARSGKARCSQVIWSGNDRRCG